MEDARKTLAETNPETAARQRQIEALNEQIAQIKQANQGKLPDRADLSETDRQLELVYAELQQRLADTMQSYGEQNYQVKQLKAQIAAIQNQDGGRCFRIPGGLAPFAIISITGVPDAPEEMNLPSELPSRSETSFRKNPSIARLPLSGSSIRACGAGFYAQAAR